MKHSDNGTLQWNSLTVQYGDFTVIENMSDRFSANTITGLIGPNGAGKTTLLLTLSGQFRPKNGEVIYNGKDIYRHNHYYKLHTGFAHEQPFFYEYMTVTEFLEFIGRIREIPAETHEKRMQSLLENVRLADEAYSPVSALSQGMRKKLAICSALTGYPEILFLDEALNGIDFESVYYIKKLLKEYAESGKTVILSTHVLEVIENLCDRYLVMKQGRIIADIDAEEYRKSATGKPSGSLETDIISMLNKENDR